MPGFVFTAILAFVETGEARFAAVLRAAFRRGGRAMALQPPLSMWMFVEAGNISGSLKYFHQACLVFGEAFNCMRVFADVLMQSWPVCFRLHPHRAAGFRGVFSAW
ncbi:MAG: hypothetical protein AB7O60_03760 [Variibacter sp.]